MKTRTESDSLGDVEVPENALYGAQTQRAIDNFRLSSMRFPPSFIAALALIKRCAAVVNSELGLLSPESCAAICKACDQLVEGQHLDQFPLDVFQTGSGTSTNMNMNEVIAEICQRHLDVDVHPNDDVNMGQSSNDVIPTAIHVSAAIQIEQRLLPAMDGLIEVIEHKATELEGIVKTGRTHLMDAMPITFAQALSGWSAQIVASRENLRQYLPSFQQIAQGGTAVGTGVNTDADFKQNFAKALQRETGIHFTSAENLFRSISSQDSSVTLSGHLKKFAVVLNKISTDLRWMNSGPLSGLGEIELVALQPGSSIMPGKVNPVIPEAVSMACAQVIGNDATITTAGMSGNFELNVMLPVVAYNLLQSIELLQTSAEHLGDLAIKSFRVNKHNIEKSLALNPILATSLNPIIGYEAAAEIAKAAYKSGRAILEVALEKTDLSEEELKVLLNPANLVDND